MGGTVTVPFIPKQQLNNLAEFFLIKVYNCPLEDIPLPIDIETIIEYNLNYSLRFDNLDQLLGKQGVLGFLDSENKQIYVDSTLEEKKQEGRLRFTLAHEVAHHILHVPLKEAHQAKWFNQTVSSNNVKSIGEIMTSTQAKDIEWQANYLGSHLLIPRTLLKREAAKCRALFIKEYKQGFSDNYIDKWVKNRLQQTFLVSKEALEIAWEDTFKRKL
ncbi:MAG: ImmA/IrrE family metallo-endopeptidase [Candidatus Melainabacteria bacterium]|jgi:Zn-dependent peptidase ImmA (M78 family)|nr:ImmA/IrrE family metallo-endopeptidase [Candidatus Melainabacteria bacterium]